MNYNNNKHMFEAFKQALLLKKQNLEQELSQFAKKDQNVKGDWDSKFPRVPEGNLEEAADEVEQYSETLPVEHTLELQLQDVDTALERIEKGTYGKCENCKKDISKERLQALPEAKLCSECTNK
ncbi:MAG: TraR/DksA C4-type zinc finger protein [bacterium]|nr:TraR/DksA C4-type zinc finger protein [bacterium]